jgi:hypothetical protein
MTRPSELWPKRARIIEVGATSGAIGARLVAEGFRNYLAVARSASRRDAMTRRWPELIRHATVALPLNDIRQNNAEVLLLDGWAALAMGRYRSVRHAELVALKLQFRPLCWISLMLAAIQCLMFRIGFPRVVNCGRSGAGPWLLAFRNRKPRPYNAARRFIPHDLGIAGFLHHVNGSGAGHAVLRWFEKLPQLPPGEDIDLLVEDARLEEVRTLLDSGPGIQPIDVYSVTGLPGADFRSIPYYPPHLAEKLLARSVMHRALCSVPAPQEHFLSLAYHALYHKGYASGIPATASAKSRRASAGHDYTAILQHIAQRLRLPVLITLEALDEYLDAQGWRPPHDMLIRLSRHNRWVRSLLQQSGPREAADDRIAVFLVREEALRRGGAARVEEMLRKHCFEILMVKEFDADSAAKLARTIRGGNWGRGPWPISGGPPVAAIVAFDPCPIAPSRQQKKRFPFLANARLLCKDKLRDAFNEELPRDQHCNVIHSSDNGREALDYLRIIMPDEVDNLIASLQGPSAVRAA